MARQVAIWAVVIVSQLLVACETLVMKPSEKVLRLYQGSPRPLTEVAVLRSAPAKMRQDGSALVTVELMGVNGKRFRRKGGWGNGTFEVHLWPGTHTLHLRYRAIRPSTQPGRATEEIAADKEAAFILVAQAGHAYLLSGEIVAEFGKSVQWLPVVFDKTRRTAWRRENKIKGPEQGTPLSEEAVQTATDEELVPAPTVGDIANTPARPAQR